MLFELLEDLEQFILLLRENFRQRVDSTQIETKEKTLKVQTEDVVNDILRSRGGDVAIGSR
jgi:hypothetical protein